MPSFEIPVDIFISIKKSDERLGEQNTEIQVKNQLIFQKMALLIVYL